MAHKGHTDAQIGMARRQVPARRCLRSCRKLGIAKTTFYHWNQRHADMGVAEIRRAQISGYVVTCKGSGLKASPVRAS